MAEGRKWMKTRMIIEIAGFPKEHIENTIVLLGEKFAEGLKTVKVIKRLVREPVQIKNSKIWSGFVEFHCDVQNLATMIGLIFDYMPSSVEIIEPESITEDTPYLNGILNDMAAKLHQYDATVKTLRAETRVLGKELKKKDVPKDKPAA
jgi:hypothetical protein